jgi:superfamily II DNA or RNA helicase
MGQKLLFRPYQSEGLRDIFAGWTSHDILMFILATGGGKTVTFMEVVRQFLYQNKNVMVVAHREELIMNTWQTLYDNRIFAGIVKAKCKPNPDLRCQVASIQTLARRQQLPAADLIVIDEGHHAQDDNSYGNLFAKYPNAKVLLVTATPYRLSGKGFRYLVPDSTKETKLIINKTRFELQQEAYLVPYRFFIVDVPDMSKVSKRGREYDEEESEKAMLKLAPLVDSWVKYCPGKQGIVFAVNVHHSMQIVKQYKERGITAAHIDAETPKEIRKEIFAAFKRKEILILCNVGIATEGVDIPGVEFIQLARPTMSLSLVEQMLGRGSRALAGVVDGPDAQTIEQRKQRIAASAKPYCIILDNAGCLIEHSGVITGKIDWPRHFMGTKQTRELFEDIEITVFVAEDKDGNQIRTNNAKEIIGLELVEITTENQHKIINIKSLKHFDKLYVMGKHIKGIQKPGLFAFKEYVKYCIKNGYFINETCWNYIEDALVKRTEDEASRYEANCISIAGVGFLASDAYDRAIKQIKKKGMSKNQFDYFKLQYDKGGRNFD